MVSKINTLPGKIAQTKNHLHPFSKGLLFKERICSLLGIHMMEKQILFHLVLAHRGSQTNELPGAIAAEFLVTLGKS